VLENSVQDNVLRNILQDAGGFQKSYFSFAEGHFYNIPDCRRWNILPRKSASNCSAILNLENIHTKKSRRLTVGFFGR
jgi:hypothetical protein